VIELIEQPASGDFRLFNAGVYAFTQQIFETLDTLSVERGELLLTAAIQQLIGDRYDIRAVRTDHFWMDATHPWDLHCHRHGNCLPVAGSMLLPSVRIYTSTTPHTSIPRQR